jgi:hypothetical protein
VDTIEMHLQSLSKRMAKDPKASIQVEDVVDMLLDVRNYVDTLAMPFDGDELTKTINRLKKK